MTIGNDFACSFAKPRATHETTNKNRGQHVVQTRREGCCADAARLSEVDCFHHSTICCVLCRDGGMVRIHITITGGLEPHSLLKEPQKRYCLFPQQTCAGKEWRDECIGKSCSNKSRSAVCVPEATISSFGQLRGSVHHPLTLYLRTNSRRHYTNDRDRNKVERNCTQLVGTDIETN